MTKACHHSLALNNTEHALTPYESCAKGSGGCVFSCWKWQGTASCRWLGMNGKGQSGCGGKGFAASWLSERYLHLRIDHQSAVKGNETLRSRCHPEFTPAGGAGADFTDSAFPSRALLPPPLHWHISHSDTRIIWLPREPSFLHSRGLNDAPECDILLWARGHLGWFGGGKVRRTRRMRISEWICWKLSEEFSVPIRYFIMEINYATAAPEPPAPSRPGNRIRMRSGTRKLFVVF